LLSLTDWIFQDLRCFIKLKTTDFSDIIAVSMSETHTPSWNMPEVTETKNYVYIHHGTAIQSAQSIAHMRQYSNLTNFSSAAIRPLSGYCLSLAYLTALSIAQIQVWMTRR
jgi:hypothetical protein